jgi:alpha-galactosidase
LNGWEAVWFDHDLDRLTRLADLAAAVGVERFVLDDGWFGARRDDHAGLGDWVVAPEVWPQGLAPLADHVRALGMQFGLWFEPEMVNADSDLFRDHPGWILATGGRTPPEQRFQQVLDLAVPGAFDHVLEQMTQVLTGVPVDYVKWDHNRDLVDAGSSLAGGRPGVRARTVAFYRLLDALAERFPDIEWESCASGGGRVDLGVLERTQRVWTSDQNDAQARQSIQRWTGQLVAPEYLGAHVSAPVSEQTHRALSLDFRAGTAFAGSLGIEWDLTRAGDEDRAALAEWVAAHRRHRELLHAGRVFRVDSPEPSVWVHGVVAQDRGSALVACVQFDDAVHAPPRVRVPGLDPARRYAVTRIRPSAAPRTVQPGSVTGAVLADLGLPGPDRYPASVVWWFLEAVA